MPAAGGALCQSCTVQWGLCAVRLSARLAGQGYNDARNGDQRHVIACCHRTRIPGDDDDKKVVRCAGIRQNCEDFNRLPAARNIMSDSVGSAEHALAVQRAYCTRGSITQHMMCQNGQLGPRARSFAPQTPSRAAYRCRTRPQPTRGELLSPQRSGQLCSELRRH